MKKNISFSGLLCNTFGHKYKMTHQITSTIKEYRCVKCGKEVATNMKGKVEVITERRRELHHAMVSFMEKKMNRKTTQLG